MNSSRPDTPFNKGPDQSTDRKGCLRHATIRQILNATPVESWFEIDGQEVGFVLIIANVYDVDYNGGKLDFGLDDGTGRIRAHLWEVEEEDAKQEQKSLTKSFMYIRAIGKISEYHGIHSIRLVKKHFVVDPHEVYHHLLSVMAESTMFQRGPPDRSLVPTTQEKANIQPPETLSMHILQNNLPDSGEDTIRPPDAALRRSTSPDDLFHVPDRCLDISPASSLVMPEFHETSYQGDNNGKDGFSPMKSEPISPTRPQRPRHLASPPRRVLSVSTKSSAVSTATVTEYQASPEFVSPKSSPPRPSHLYHGFESSDLGGAAAPSGEDTKTSLDLRRATKMPVSRRRDPYSHLSALQRDIILNIQNAQSMSNATGEPWRGVSITILVQAIARHRHGLAENEVEEAFDFLLEEGYIHTTIDDHHFDCA